MSPQKPENWPRCFEQHLNAGDLDGVMALYAPDARFVSPSGETIVGRDGIRRVVAELIGKKTRLHGEVVRVVPAGDVAVLYTDWQRMGTDPSGNAVENASRAIEIVRRQSDGTWQLIVGDPNGRS